MKKQLLTLIACSAAVTANAQVMVEPIIADSVFSVENGSLVEKAGDQVLVSYEKAALPAKCSALSVEGFEEKYKTQPTADVVGSWKMKIEKMDGDNQPAEWSAYTTIASNGRLVSYDLMDECYIVEVSELDGNKRTFAEPEFNVEISKIKLTSLSKQLAVVTEQTETFEINGSEESYSFLSARAYNKAQQLPNECDVQAAVPKTETSNDNPTLALTGAWESADNNGVIAYSGEQNQQISYREFFVVTDGGFLLDAFYESIDGAATCKVNYIGETKGDLYTR